MKPDTSIMKYPTSASRACIRACNTSYWQGVSYLGCGPSAHSFDGQTREWNCSSIEKYMSGIESGQRDFEREERDLTTRYNEFIITSVRTQWGNFTRTPQ